jgi:hypothetical protein
MLFGRSNKVCENWCYYWLSHSAWYVRRLLTLRMWSFFLTAGLYMQCTVLSGSHQNWEASARFVKREIRSVGFHEILWSCLGVLLKDRQTWRSLWNIIFSRRDRLAVCFHVVIMWSLKIALSLPSYGERQRILLTYLLTYVHTYLLTYVLTYLLTYLFTYSLTYSLTHSLTYSLTYLLTHLLTHSLTHSLTYFLSHLRIYSLTYLITYLLTSLLTYLFTHFLT